MCASFVNNNKPAGPLIGAAAFTRAQLVASLLSNTVAK